MAAPLGREDPAVAEDLFAAPYRFAFFQAVRLLERRDPSRAPVGRLARPADEAARFRSWISLAFPPSEVMALTDGPGPGAPPEVTVAFLAARKLPEPVTYEFAGAVQEALSGLEKITVKADELRQALLQGGSPATPDELRKRFDALISERGKGKDATKLRFVIE